MISQTDWNNEILLKGTQKQKQKKKFYWSQKPEIKIKSLLYWLHNLFLFLWYQKCARNLLWRIKLFNSSILFEWKHLYLVFKRNQNWYLL